MPADTRNNDGAVREIPLPDDARQRSTLDRLDYTDGFVVDITGCRHLTAEQWARAVLEGAPPSFRRTAPWAWRALGLERGPLSSDHSILSWPIKQRSEDVILLSAQGRLGMSGELLLEVHGDHLRFGTMLELRTWFARAEWARIEAPHRRIVAGLLGQARRHQLA